MEDWGVRELYVPACSWMEEKCGTVYNCISSARRCCRDCSHTHHLIHHVVTVAMFFLHKCFGRHHRCLNTIVCVCRRRVEAEIFSRSMTAVFKGSRLKDLFRRWRCLKIFVGTLMCMCCVHVCTHTHTHTACRVTSARMWAEVSGRNTWRARRRKILRCTAALLYMQAVFVYEVHIHIYRWYAGLHIDLWTLPAFLIAF